MSWKKIRMVDFFFWFKRVLDWDPEQRESKMTVLCQLITIIFISYVILYYIIIIILLIMENHPSRKMETKLLWLIVDESDI